MTETPKPLSDSELAEQLRTYTNATTNDGVVAGLNARLSPPLQVVISQYADGSVEITPIGTELDVQVIQGMLLNAQAMAHNRVVQHTQAQRAKQAAAAKATSPVEHPGIADNRATRRKAKHNHRDKRPA